MEILVKVAQLILSLSILVILHEFGHFIFAKIFKTRVEKFYLFFNPGFSLFRFKKGETEYGLGWLPLGGYVKITGMIDESMDKEQMKKPPEPHEFRSKPSWQRLLIMLGGVLVNFILALIIYSAILYTWGDQYLPAKNVKYGIMADSLAKDIGLKDGDKIIALDNKPVVDFYKIVPNIVLEEVQTIQVEREGNKREIPVPDRIIPELMNTADFILPRLPFYVAGFTKDSPAKKAGIKVDDKLIAINNQPVEFYDEFKNTL